MQTVTKKFFTESSPNIDNKKTIKGITSHQIKINNNIELILFDRSFRLSMGLQNIKAIIPKVTIHQKK